MSTLLSPMHLSRTDSSATEEPGAVRGVSRSRESADAVYSERLRRVRAKPGDLILFTTQLAVMLDSGVILSDALDAIAEQAADPRFKAVILDLSERVKGGDMFSKALACYPYTFNTMFISMVKASEASGRMVEMLTVLTGYLNFETDTRKQIRSALTYPIIMVLMAIAATGTLMFFVLPRFMRIYASRGAELPKLTQVLVGISKILGNFEIMTVLLTTAIFVGAVLWYWLRTPMGRRALDAAKIHTPVMGTMYVDMVVTRSMRILATMVNTGVRLLDAIRVIQGVVDNYHFKRLWGQVDEKIQDGYQLSESILIAEGSDLIAPGIIQMLRAGEKSGRLGEVCDKVSVFYQKKLETSIRNVMTLIEPLMITILGAIIGTIAIALLLPVFRVSSVIAH
ncbi:MAG TPA: type II secretion system F family protein [Sedimentisphaerales bacterium]|nr:type II secretion system F family protein [Sedimentisphaerales bacterium]HQG48156.1 type II secretion system F family protein [Sedimentisphaerales bacterium]HQI27601.1 type II secretion system F family protein [Sedimentisphaerales bacterium]